VAKGIYTIIIELDKAMDVPVGTRRRYYFQKGYYAYVGSALSGLEQRVRRHLSPMKKHHWHIDYLLERARIQNIIYAETGAKKECALANALFQRLPAVAGFGCSDCRCQSHLFFCPEWQALENLIINAFRTLGLEPLPATNAYLAGQ
jgi:Uri superfamily endonuclease